MKSLILPNGEKITIADDNTSYLQVLEEHAPKKVKQALAIDVDGDVFDLQRTIVKEGQLKVLTFSSDAGKKVFWHSSAHVLAQALRRLYADIKFDDGPALTSGPGHFYYDVYTSAKITEDDFAKIETEIAKVVAEDAKISRRVMSRADALKKFSSEEEIFKVSIIKNLPEDAEISLYAQGDFEDLCRGPHVLSTGVLGHFKLTTVSGAYWKGDITNPMLQRIYGVSFPTEKEVRSYLNRIEEAKKRDHRKLGRELDLFHLQAEAPGMVFWHKKGWAIYRELEQFIRQKISMAGYHEVKTPMIADQSLWQKSGHAEKFAEGMFFTESEDKQFAIKPMNCPCHIEIFKQGMKSYRDLPLRMAEFGSCHRNEPSGTLHGLMRVRAFTQDDAHIFCTEEQIQDEIIRFIDLLYNVYAKLGFDKVLIKLSTRPEKRVGTDEMWQAAEQALEQALNQKNIDWQLNPGEGAFYGPKIEFSLLDTLDRVWQCGTIQVDYSTPGRLGAEYIGADGKKKTPVMLHRAILGSFERFLGILIEHYAGKFPLWLSPVQVMVLTVSENQNSYAKEISNQLADQGFRVENDLRNEKIGYKVREFNQQKANFAIVLGQKEEDEKNISVRARGEKETHQFSLEDFITKLKTEL